MSGQQVTLFELARELQLLSIHLNALPAAKVPNLRYLSELIRVITHPNPSFTYSTPVLCRVPSHARIM